MKLKLGESFLVLPPVGLLRSISVRLEGQYLTVAQVDLPTIQRCRKKDYSMRGIPVIASFEWTDERPILELFPAADRDYEIEINYYPPLQTC